MKAVIYVDAENIRLNGGYGMNVGVLRNFVEDQGFRVVRANYYMALDSDLERNDRDKYLTRERFRRVLQRYGYCIRSKKVAKYEQDDGSVSCKANSDIDICVDAITQAEDFDLVVLLTGDNDFVPLVHALQNKGCRVDVVAFRNYGNALANAADYFWNGYLIEGLLATQPKTQHGYLRSWKSGGYGFLTRYYDDRNGVFVHARELGPDILDHIDEISDCEGFVFEYQVDTVPADDTVEGEEKVRAKDVALLSTVNRRLKSSLKMTWNGKNNTQ